MFPIPPTLIGAEVGHGRLRSRTTASPHPPHASSHDRVPRNVSFQPENSLKMGTMSQSSPWWKPDVHADRQPLLRARRRVLAALRDHLETRDFVEVETAILQVSPGNETHLHAFA